MSDRVWFLNTAEGQAGPYTAEELRQWRAAGQITDDWYVWKEGLAGWQRVGDTVEIASPAPAAAPPPQPVAPQPAPKPRPVAAATSAAAKSEPAPEPAAKKKEKKGLPRPVVLGLATIGVLLALALGGGAIVWFAAPEVLDPLLVSLGLSSGPPPPAAPLDLGPQKSTEQIAAEREARDLLMGFGAAGSLAQLLAPMGDPLAAQVSMEILSAAAAAAEGSDSSALKRASAGFLRDHGIDLEKDTDSLELWARLAEGRDSYLADLDVLAERAGVARSGAEAPGRLAALTALVRNEIEAESNEDASAVKIRAGGERYEVRKEGDAWRLHPSETNDEEDPNPVPEIAEAAAQEAGSETAAP